MIRLHDQIDLIVLSHGVLTADLQNKSLARCQSRMYQCLVPQLFREFHGRAHHRRFRIGGDAEPVGAKADFGWRAGCSGMTGNQKAPAARFEKCITACQTNQQTAGKGAGQNMKSASQVLLPEVDAWIARATEQIAYTSRILTGLFDPELIVLGGAMPAAILNELSGQLQNRDIQGPSRGLSVCPISATRLGDFNGAIGAASIPFFERYFPGSNRRGPSSRG